MDLNRKLEPYSESAPSQGQGGILGGKANIREVRYNCRLLISLLDSGDGEVSYTMSKGYYTITC